jgi:hypothetical protein
MTLFRKRIDRGDCSKSINRLLRCTGIKLADLESIFGEMARDGKARITVKKLYY